MSGPLPSNPMRPVETAANEAPTLDRGHFTGCTVGARHLCLSVGFTCANQTAAEWFAPLGEEPRPQRLWDGPSTLASAAVSRPPLDARPRVVWLEFGGRFG